jgi:hypothetical protein
MDTIVLKPTRSEVQYQGKFDHLHFDPLVNPAPLYQNLLTALGKYGVTLPNLTYLAPPAADANITCFLNQLNTISQVRLDRVEIHFSRLHEVGVEIARQILLDSWTALHEADGSISIVEHGIALSVYTEIQEASYDQVLGRYVMMPSDLEGISHAGIAFYLAGDSNRGEGASAIVLDRIMGQEHSLLLKITATFDGKQIPVDGLMQEIETYLSRYLDHLGLELDRGEAQ